MPDIRTTPVLDDFNRADADPIDGNWAFSGLISGYDTMAISDNSATHSTASGSGDAYWTAGSWSDDVIEVWGRANGGNVEGIAWALDFYLSPGSGAVDGYRLRQQVSSGGPGPFIYRVDNGARTDITGTTYDGGFSAAPVPTYVLARITQSTGYLEMWETYDGTGPGSGWIKVVDATDNTYTGSFYIAMGITDSSGFQLLGWTEFGGGAQRTNRTQIYRWIKN